MGCRAVGWKGSRITLFSADAEPFQMQHQVEWRLVNLELLRCLQELPAHVALVQVLSVEVLLVRGWVEVTV